MNEVEDHFPFENPLQNNKPQQQSGTAVTPVKRSHAIEVDSSRAMQEVQAALVIAKKFPRDEVEAETQIITSCRRFSFSERALYSYPRGKDASGKRNMISGPSIRMAEMMAQAWGNLEFGFRELERTPTTSLVETFCWDMQRNTRAKRTINIDLKLQLKDGQTKILTDPRDQYEMVANQAQRRVRACILEILPADLVEKATMQIRRTLAVGDKAEIPLIDRVKKLVSLFHELGVTKEKLEARLGHKMEDTSIEEVVDLISIFNGIREGATKREDWFDYGKAEEGGKASAADEALAKAQEKKK